MLLDSRNLRKSFARCEAKGIRIFALFVFECAKVHPFNSWLLPKTRPILFCKQNPTFFGWFLIRRDTQNATQKQPRDTFFFVNFWVEQMNQKRTQCVDARNASSCGRTCLVCIIFSSTSFSKLAPIDGPSSQCIT